MDANNWEDSDYEALKEEAKKGMFLPGNWLAFACSESGLVNAPNKGPKAYNQFGGARGLWQAMPNTLKWMGWTPFNEDYKSANGEFRNLSIPKQIAWSRMYLDTWRKKFDIENWDTARDMYLANFMPAYLIHRKDPEYVIIDHERWPLGYKVNAGFDREKKGYITIQDLQIAIDRAVATKAYKIAIASLTRLT